MQQHAALIQAVVSINFALQVVNVMAQLEKLPNAGLANGQTVRTAISDTGGKALAPVVVPMQDLSK